MQWNASREATIEEDRVYCALDIFDVSMPIIYGEGYDKALWRLQKEIKDLGKREKIADPMAALTDPDDEHDITEREREEIEWKRHVLREFEHAQKEKMEIEQKKKESERIEDEVRLRSVLVESLSFDRIEARENTIKRALETTCGWLLTSPKYQQWLNSTSFSNQHGLLWIKGKPGVGKSTLHEVRLCSCTPNHERNLVLSCLFLQR
jgi:hypothetical protein